MNPSPHPASPQRQNLAEPPSPIVQQTLAEVVSRNKSILAQTFYQHMMENPAAAEFLSVKTVEDRLKPGLERWLGSLFCHQSNEELRAVLAMQRHIGEVHARAEIPVFLVARGMRLLKHEISNRLLETALNRDDLVSAILRTDYLIDIAFEEMSAAFVCSHESGVRVAEAYRVFTAGHNLPLEREKQLGALLDWENRLFRTLATELPFNDLSPLSNSPFGLWLHHKAPMIFKGTRELPLIDECLQRIDDVIFPLFTLSPDEHLQAETIRDLVKTTMLEVEHIKFLFKDMFERMTDLEIGRDVLTQLFNRRFLQPILKQEIELSRRKESHFCVLMLDIDFFKKVNDQHGHDAGDRVLQTVAGLLIEHVRASDFVFRYGGEEFLIVLAEADATQARVVAEKIRRSVEAATIPLSNHVEINVTLSIGMAVSDGHPDYQRMLDRADKALYTAKNTGRNRCVVADT